MEFSLRKSDFRPFLDLYQIIYAAGEIKTGDTKSFEELCSNYALIPGASVYFDSNGGSLYEGLLLGKKIREMGFNTHVGANNKDGSKVAYCASAAAIAYMGGIYRYIYEDALFGVHQFSLSEPKTPVADPLSLGQEISGEIISYILESGISAELFQHMVSAKSDDINWISYDDLRRMNVVNDGIRSQTWDIQIIEGVQTLRGHQIGLRGEHKLILHIAPKGNVIAMVFFGTSYKEETISESASVHLRIDHEMYEVAQSAIDANPSIMNDFVFYMFDVDHNLFEKIRSSEFIGAATQPVNRAFYAGFDMKTSLHKEKINQFLRSAEIARSAAREG
jgi:hypothetical protein